MNIQDESRCGCEKCEEARKSDSVKRFEARMADERQRANASNLSAGIAGAPYRHWAEPGIANANDPRDRSIGVQAALMELTKKIQEADIATIAVMEENETLTQCVTLLQTANEKLREELRVEREEWAPDTRALHRVRDVLSRFHGSELSMSSVAPVLALAEELNPGLVKR